MRCYKLGYTGAAAMGCSPIQIIASGRVRSVQLMGTWEAAATKNCAALISVGTAGVNEYGQPSSAPINFAGAAVQAQGAAAAVTRSSFNTAVDCDAQVVAGQQLVLNSVDDSTGFGTFVHLEAYVWVG